MRNPIALNRLAGLALAASLAASCGVEVTSGPAIMPGTDPETTTGAPEGSSDAEKGEAAATATPDGEKEGTETPPAPPTGEVSTWTVGGTIPSGIEGVKDIDILEVRNNGTGPVCGNGKSATVRYKAMLSDGTVKDPGPIYTFDVGRSSVIKGWHIAISQMRAGDSLVVMIPAALAYQGTQDWKFEMELVSFK